MMHEPQRATDPTFEPIEIAAGDGRRLAARTFHGPGPDVVVVAGGAGIPQYYYTDLAGSIRDRGPSVITFDYRGMAASRRRHPRDEPVRMRDWAVDVEGVLQHAQARASGRVLWLGHSAGGWLLPLAASRHVPARIVTVGTLSGHWKLMTRRERVRLSLAFRVVFPAVSALVGYVPGRLWGGDHMPAGVARDWGRWCREPDFLRSDATLDTSGFGDITAPILAMRATDDAWATAASHRAIHAWFTRADVSVVEIAPADVGADAIGHLGLTRRSIGGQAWPDLLDWLLAEPAPAGEPTGDYR